jgi:predicted SnoaL-like aldol condensation-catalyzing enzyme
MPVQGRGAVIRAAVILALGLAPAAATPVLADNRRIVDDFVRIFYGERDVRRAFMTYVAPDYIQHNPGIADGRDAAIAALAPMFARPGARFVVKRILVDGDLAMIHLHGRGDPTTAGAAVADIYRLKNGRIVEHWDVIQPMPKSSANPHPMF